MCWATRTAREAAVPVRRVRGPVTAGRLLLHPAPGLRRAIDPGDIFFLEATGDDTRVRTRGAHPLIDVRPLGELERILIPWGFVRTHRNYVVNPERVREVRRRTRGEDWELKLDPPVNRVLPVSRSALGSLWAAFGEGRQPDRTPPRGREGTPRRAQPRVQAKPALR